VWYDEPALLTAVETRLGGAIAVMGSDCELPEQLAAQMVGKEAAVFVPSGTMGNQMAIATHTKPGDAIIVEEEAHVIFYEVGAPAVFANVLTWTLPSDRGVMDPSEMRRRITKRNIHTPGTTLICIEDTHNRAGGTVIPLDVLAEYRKVGDEFGIKIHVDGARIFNAAVAQGVHVSEITKHVDTVNFCLSKGLRAPVGSILAGPAEFIDAARFWRKRLGGGMRQAGILAACGIISLTKMVVRLAEDHAAHLSPVRGWRRFGGSGQLHDGGRADQGGQGHPIRFRRHQFLAGGWISGDRTGGRSRRPHH
jgi:threonine aldolase